MFTRRLSFTKGCSAGTFGFAVALVEIVVGALGGPLLVMTGESGRSFRGAFAPVRLHSAAIGTKGPKAEVLSRERCISGPWVVGGVRQQMVST